MIIIRENRMFYCNKASPFHLVSVKHSTIQVVFDAAEANFFILYLPPGAVLSSREPLSWVLQE